MNIELRDYFAAKALAIIPAYFKDINDWEYKDISKFAYELANAMLMERDKEIALDKFIKKQMEENV